MSNPVINKISQLKDSSNVTQEKVNAESIAQKIGILGVVTSASAFIAWQLANPALIITGVLALPIILLTAFKPLKAQSLAIPYAVLQGLCVGTFAKLSDQQYPKVASQALMLTSIVLFSLLYSYIKLNLRLSTRAKNTVKIATGTAAIFYLLSLGLWALSATTTIDITPPLLFSNSPLGILFTLALAALAAFNFLLDFDRIEQAIAQGLSKEYEWALSLGVLVTFIWLYIEILRLLSKLRSN
jgi:uncharacterized YccA/Bax inhibitor family protein